MAFSQGPKNCGTCVDDSGTGTLSWQDSTATALEGDEVSASGGDFAIISTSPGNSHYLKCTNFGFTIPPNMVILGILVEPNIDQAGTGNDCHDNAVRIVKNGTIQSTDKSNGANWPDSPAYRSYGSSSDLWGTSFTASDVNASTFGYAHSVNQGSVGFDPVIDHVRITVYYDLPCDNSFF